MSSPFVLAVIAAFAGVGGRIAMQWWRRARTSPLRGSIARVVTWSGSSGTVSLLSGPSKETVVAAWCEIETSIGEHVVLTDETPRGWRVVHLDDA